MASITLTDGTVATLTISELIEYQSVCQARTDRVAQIAVEKATVKRNSAPKPVATEVASDDSEPDVNVYSVMAGCGHAVLRNSPRGRKPALCSDCKNGSNGAEVAKETPEVKQEAPKAKQNGGNRRGGKKNGGRDFSEWLAEHGEDEMTEGMERSIRFSLKTKEIPAKFRKEIVSALDSDERMNCATASEFIQRLYKLPKVKA